MNRRRSCRLNSATMGPTLGNDQDREILAQAAPLAEQLANIAGATIRKYFRKDPATEAKADASLVTIADREAEAAMRQLIERTFPDHGIAGEEWAPRHPDADWQWHLDPIDGTHSFVAGMPVFGTLIALAKDRQPLLGVLDQPILQERWAASINAPTTLNGTPVQSRACRDLAQAILFTTDTGYFSNAQLGRFQAVQQRCRLTRFSADCYAFAMVASGYADIVIESALCAHDFAAIIPVIEGAGGRVTDWAGNALRLGPGQFNVLAVGDAALLDPVSAILTDTV